MPERGSEERLALLHDLVRLQRPVSALVDQLHTYPWDVDHPLLFVSVADVTRILEAFLSDDISADTVSEWADAVEMREDIQLDERLVDFFMEASSPEIFEPVSGAFARRWLTHLKSKE